MTLKCPSCRKEFEFQVLEIPNVNSIGEYDPGFQITWEERILQNLGPSQGLDIEELQLEVDYSCIKCVECRRIINEKLL